MEKLETRMFTRREEGIGSSARRGPRVLLYSHDSFGLGHLRRSLTIASAVAENIPGATALIATGSPCATHFPIPAGVDLLKLPSVSKDANGSYMPRSLGGSLDEIVRLRSKVLQEAFRAFDPDLLIVDHQVTGLRGELLPVLKEARERGVRTLLGMRDVIDSPAAVRKALATPASRWALESAYDAICVYGEPEVFDPRVEYRFPLSVRRRLQFSGYIVRPVRSRSREPVPLRRKHVVVTVGGGEDGAKRIESYLGCLALSPPSWRSTIVTGPLLDRARVRDFKHRARRLQGVEVRRFHADLPGLMQGADAVVSMAGYNSSAEVLQSGRPSVLLPRTFPRQEQQIRAERLARLGLVRALDNPTAAELREAVETSLEEKESRDSIVRLDGSDYVCGLVRELTSQPIRRSVPA